MTGYIAVPPSPTPSRHPASAPARLFAGPCRPIRVAGIGQLADQLARFVIDWPSRKTLDDGASDIEIGIEAGTITLDSRTPGAVPLAFADPADAANALVGALIGAYIAQDAGLFSLHAACTVIAGRAVAMMGPSGAGKSSLAVCLARAGQCFVCDDRVAVRVPTGDAAPQVVALGLAAKLRLPLPPESGADHAHYVARHEIHAGDDLVHLRFDPPERLTFGATAPLAAIVMLDRCADGPVRLAPAARANLARAVLADAVAPHLSAPALMALTARLSERVAAFTLTFADSAAAAKAIMERFAETEPSR